MVSHDYPPETLENAQLDVMLDGFFHTFTWIAVAVGLTLLWRAVRAGGLWTWRARVGWIPAGWGIFNVVEGSVNHHLLYLHRVEPDAANPLALDIGFLVFGVLLIVGGAARPQRPASELRLARAARALTDVCDLRQPRTPRGSAAPYVIGGVVAAGLSRWQRRPPLRRQPGTASSSSITTDIEHSRPA